MTTAHTISTLSFLTPGNYPDDDPRSGLEDTLRLFEIDRLWYGGASARSVRWSAQNGLNMLTGNIVRGESSDDFAESQLALITEYRRAVDPALPARIALGRVIVPTDGADRATRERYRAYAAGRYERTLKPSGERRILFAPDLVCPAEEILERLHADVAFAQAPELRLELPYEFHRGDYEQILHDAATLIGPALGWRPAAGPIGVRAADATSAGGVPAGAVPTGTVPV